VSASIAELGLQGRSKGLAMGISTPLDTAVVALVAILGLLGFWLGFA